MSNEIRNELKPEIDKIIHKWMLQTHYEFGRRQHTMGVMFSMAPRAYANIESQKNGSSLQTFLLYLFRGCPNVPAFLMELNEKLDEMMPIQNPEEVVTQAFLAQLRWIQQANAHDYTCPHCGQRIEWEKETATATH